MKQEEYTIKDLGGIITAKVFLFIMEVNIVASPAAPETMMLQFLQPFLDYAKNVSPLKMLFHFVVLCVCVTWMAVMLIVSTNFNTIVSMYNGIANDKQLVVEKELKRASDVQKTLDKQRALLGVDRMFVSKYHDGEKDMVGIHFLFLSRVNESRGQGISSEMIRTQNLPAAMYSDMFLSISKHQCYVTQTNDNNTENKSFLKEMGIETRIVCPIFADNDVLVGVLGVDSVKHPLNTKEIEDIEPKLLMLSSFLGSIMTAD